MIIGTPIWRCVSPAPPLEKFPGGKLTVDVAVIGAGISGLAAALALLQHQPGRRVVVLEADTIGAGASGRSTGMLTPGVGQDLPGQVRRFGPAIAGAMYRRTIVAVEDAAKWITDLAIDCDVHMGGQLIVARTAGSRRRLVRTAACLAALGLPWEPLDPPRLAARIRLRPPVIPLAEHSDPVALRLPIAGTLDPGKLVAGLAREFVARGGCIFHQSPVIGRPRQGKIALAGGGSVIAERVVVATGGWTPHLGFRQGRILPVHLHVIATAPLPSGVLAQLSWPGREGVIDARRLFSYARRTIDDRVIFGGGAPYYRWGGNPQPLLEPAGFAKVLEEFGKFLPQPLPLVDYAWSGLIDYVVDGLPAIQRCPHDPSLIHVSGFCGHGIALALAAGHWVRHMVDHGEPPDDLPWFRPDPPLIPFEITRWSAFQMAIAAMSWADRR